MKGSVQSQALTVRVFRFGTDNLWHAALNDCGTVAYGYYWKLIRANYRKRSMVMVRGKALAQR